MTNYQRSGGHSRSCYLGNLQDPVASKDLFFKRQVLYSFAKTLGSPWDTEVTDALSILKDYTRSFLQSA